MCTIKPLTPSITTTVMDACTNPYGIVATTVNGTSTWAPLVPQGLPQVIPLATTAGPSVASAPFSEGPVVALADPGATPFPWYVQQQADGSVVIVATYGPIVIDIWPPCYNYMVADGRGVKWRYACPKAVTDASGAQVLLPPEEAVWWLKQAVTEGSGTGAGA